jgi:hypothetical protein
MPKNPLWPNVDGHPLLRKNDPEPTHLRIALQYGIVAAQTSDIEPEDVQRIKRVIERLSEGEPPSGYRDSVLGALGERLVIMQGSRGWDIEALRQ